MTWIHNGGGLGSEEVLFTNCNFRFLSVWSSRASLFMTDVELPGAGQDDGNVQKSPLMGSLRQKKGSILFLKCFTFI